MSIFTLLPIYWMFVVSARSRVELFSPGKFWQTTFYAPNYIKPLSSNAFQTLYRQFADYRNDKRRPGYHPGFVCNLCASRAGSSTAPTTSSSGRLRNRMAPAAAFILPLFLLFTRVFRIGDTMLFDTRIGLILLYCVFNLPFAIWLLKGIIDGIPIELDEAALVDGARRWTILYTNHSSTGGAWPRHHLHPQLDVCLERVSLCGSTHQRTKARTITTGLAEFVTVTGTNWGEMAAVATISLLPALVFLVFVQRYIVVGLTFGAVKE